MKARELRIGNLVKDPILTRKVTASLLLAFENNKEYIDLYQPIPLTEEWLKRMGFNYDDMQDTFDDDNPWYHLNYRGFRFSSDKSVNFQSVFIKLNNSTIEIKHVHQLQNLYFALTGCELEINLNK